MLLHITNIRRVSSTVSQPEIIKMSSAHEDLHCRLQQLQSRFTWDLRKEDLELDYLNRQQEHDIDLQLPGAGVHTYGFLAYVRYLQDQPEEALSLLNQSEQKARECYGEDSDLRLIVTYGDMAWLKYLTGDKTGSQTYCQRVDDILVKHPTDSSTILHPEVYGEKAWTFLKFSKSYNPKAIECFCRALELKPDDPEFNSGYAHALYRTEPYVSGPNTEESPGTKQLRRAVEINPKDGVLLSLLALKLLYQQKCSEADGLVERALEAEDDDAQTLRYVAIYFRKKDQLDESIDLLQKMLKSSQSAFIHHQLALCYNRKKKNLYLNTNQSDRTEKEQHWRRLTIQHLEEAISLKSTLNHAKASLALQYAEEFNMTRAQELFDDVLEKLDEEFWSDRQFICRCYAEFCHYHTFQKDLAVTYYKKALEFSTSTSEKRHCMKKLKLIAQRRFNKNPEDASAYGILGAVAKAEGDRSKAAEYYEEALERGGDNDEYLSALCELRSELH